MIDFKELIAKEIFNESLGLELSDIKNMIEIPADESMGDYAFPCFRLAKTLKKAPQMIASEIKDKLEISHPIEKVEVLGGYLNFYIDYFHFCSLFL